MHRITRGLAIAVATLGIAAPMASGDSSVPVPPGGATQITNDATLTVVHLRDGALGTAGQARGDAQRTASDTESTTDQTVDATKVTVRHTTRSVRRLTARTE